MSALFFCLILALTFCASLSFHVQPRVPFIALKSSRVLQLPASQTSQRPANKAVQAAGHFLPTHLHSFSQATDLDRVGEDIQILPPENGVTRIVMKFGGSSLASAERITYVAK